MSATEQTSEAQAKGGVEGDAQAPGGNGAPRALRGLAEGLLKAQRAARAVEKAARNDHQKYNYASSDDIIAEGRAAMNEGGCTLSLSSSAVVLAGNAALIAKCTVKRVKDGREYTNEFESMLLRCVFLLDHESGESREVTCDFPFQPEAGRPLDKALAAARTVALAYTYRDLLGLQRVPEGERGAEMDRRDDRPDDRPAQREERREAPPAQQAPAQPQVSAAEVLKKINEAKTDAELVVIWNGIPASMRKSCMSSFTERRQAINGGKAA